MEYDVSSVDIAALDKAIAGNRNGLLDAFHWGKMPQHASYWHDQYRSDTPLDIPALKEIRRQYLAANRERPEEPARDETTEPLDYAALAAKHGICITVAIGEVSVTYDGRE